MKPYPTRDRFRRGKKKMVLLYTTTLDTNVWLCFVFVLFHEQVFGFVCNRMGFFGERKKINNGYNPFVALQYHEKSAREPNVMIYQTRNLFYPVIDIS